MKILILGGTQFIGRAIVEALLRAHEVSVLNRGIRPLWNPRTTRLVADRTRPEEMAGALTEEYDAIVDVSCTEPEHAANLLKALPGGRAPRYVFISSAAVYNREHSRPPFGEDAPADGDAVWGPYGTAKADCEALLANGIADELTILRPPYVYGPHNTEQREQFLWARLTSGLPVFVPGDGTSRIQFCHVEDLAATVVAACEGRIPAGTYNIGEQRDYSFHEYLAVLGEVAGVPVTTVGITDPTVRAREYFPFRHIDLTLDVRRLAATGAPTGRRLADGLAQTYAWFRQVDGIRYQPTAKEQEWRTTPDR